MKQNLSLIALFYHTSFTYQNHSRFLEMFKIRDNSDRAKMEEELEEQHPLPPIYLQRKKNEKTSKNI